ncbi:hypothetical protein J7K93_04945 [bacterium]|nr:hypothetical protein [bacterium]
MKILNKNIRSAIYLILVLIFFGSCFNPFAPRLKIFSSDTGGLVVTGQKSPEEVLQNFAVSYTFKDSLLYSDIIDTAFVFVYFDPNSGTSGRYVSWGREIDLKTTGHLFRYFQVIDLVWSSTLYELVGDSTGTLGKGFSLTLMGKNENYKISGRAVFTFRKCNDEKWRIVQWKDESDL